MSYELETRLCNVCQKVEFRTLASSKRQTCSSECELTTMTGDERRRFHMTQGPRRSTKPTEEQVAERRRKDAERKRAAYAAAPEEERARKRQDWADLPEEVKKNETLAESNGPGGTESGREQSGTNGMNEIETERTPKSSSVSAVEILPEGSGPSSKSLKRVVLESDDLLRSTAEYLYSSMTGLTANRPPSELQRLDPATVNAAVGCASQIQKIMRLRLDAVKLVREMKGKKK